MLSRMYWSTLTRGSGIYCTKPVRGRRVCMSGTRTSPTTCSCSTGRGIRLREARPSPQECCHGSCLSRAIGEQRTAQSMTSRKSGKRSLWKTAAHQDLEVCSNVLIVLKFVVMFALISSVYLYMYVTLDNAGKHKK